MITIIKRPEHIALQSRLYHITCKWCGCEYTAERDDFKVDLQDKTLYVSLKCPVCELIASATSREEIAPEYETIVKTICPGMMTIYKAPK